MGPHDGRRVAAGVTDDVAGTTREPGVVGEVLGPVHAGPGQGQRRGRRRIGRLRDGPVVAG